jgi:hypothetical protein
LAPAATGTALAELERPSESPPIDLHAFLPQQPDLQPPAELEQAPSSEELPRPEFHAVPDADLFSSSAPTEALSGMTASALPQFEAPQQPVSERPAEVRLRHRPPAAENWFGSQGKFIALGFVLALVGTIYFARSNRQPDAAAIIAETPHAHPGDAGSGAPHEHSHQPTIVEAAQVSTPSAATAGTSETSPAKLSDSTAGSETSKAELHPPAIPQLASEPSSENRTATEDKLFQFPSAKRSDERLAVRPVGPTTIINHTLTQQTAPSHGQGGAPASPAAHLAATMPPAVTPPAAQLPAPPVLAPNYPVAHSPPPPGNQPGPPMGYPPPNVGVPAPAPPAESTPRYRSPYIPPAGAGVWPAAGAPAGPPPQPQHPSAAMPPQYPFQDHSARGYRHEPTGSGLH